MKPAALPPAEVEARMNAAALADEHLPTGTRAHDEVRMSRATLESMLGVAFLDGARYGALRLAADAMNTADAMKSRAS